MKSRNDNVKSVVAHQVTESTQYYSATSEKKFLLGQALVQNQLMRFVEDLNAIKVLNVSEVVWVHLAVGKLFSTPINNTHWVSRPNPSFVV